MRVVSKFVCACRRVVSDRFAAMFWPSRLCASLQVISFKARSFFGRLLFHLVLCVGGGVHTFELSVRKKLYFLSLSGYEMEGKLGAVGAGCRGRCDCGVFGASGLW